MADRFDCEVEFTLIHVPFLVGHLTGNASVWRSLGTALEFKPGDLNNIQGCVPLANNSPYSYMQRLVEEWLEGRYSHMAPPTLASLAQALQSETVGLGSLAKQIRDSLPSHDQLTSARLFEIPLASNQGEITPLNHKVNENTHVCLKVQINSKGKSYEWHNAGLVPIDDKSHSDKINEPVLYVPKVSIDMDGSKYSCKISDNSAAVHVSTVPVTLTVGCPQLDQCKESLASIYLAQPEVPQDLWPPVSNKMYINLALIKQQQLINYDKEYARLTIRKDMDDILRYKEKLGYENIFDGLRSGSLLLIEGRPGSGKTTFVHKITRDWADSEVRGPRRLLLLVSLRVLNSWEKPVTLEDILQLLNVQVSSTVLQERNGKGVCFIFDGLDEFSPLEGENSIVYRIINKNYLPLSIVIVASRPAPLVKLRQRANKIVEVIGFPKDQIFEFIDNYPFSIASKANKLKLYLLSHPNILHMCYLPIHTAMVAYTYFKSWEKCLVQKQKYTCTSHVSH